MDDKPVLVKRPERGKWALYQAGDNYMFKLRSRNVQWASTPNGSLLTTPYLVLAERILEDLNYYGIEYRGGDSVIPWHFTYIQNFSKMEHKAVEDLLDECFLQKKDWTLDVEFSKESNLAELFGVHEGKRDEIRAWLYSSLPLGSSHLLSSHSPQIQKN